MAEDGEIISDNEDFNNLLCEVEDSPNPKRPKIKWQETLINLVSLQQQQLGELSRQARVMSEPTSSFSVDENVRTHTQVHSSFQVTSYDPDRSTYPIKEWLDDVTTLKNELKVSDVLMIAKAGDALRHRGYRYFCDWRPVARTWENFCQDLMVAFPDKETPGTRAYIAATLTSRECDTLSDYGNQKLRVINRFYKQLPWNITLSMIEYGLDHDEARSAICVQKPTSERELLLLLSEFDARRMRSSTMFTSGRKIERRPREQDPAVVRTGNSTSVCFNCRRRGHHQNNCRFLQKDEASKTALNSNSDPTNVPTCDCCKKMGHTEKNCWYKNGINFRN